MTVIENCIREVRTWIRDDTLSLNDVKTEFLIISTERQLSKVSVVKIKVRQAVVTPVSSVRNLGAWFDSSRHVHSLVLFIICTISGKVFVSGIY